ncbi:MAG: lytic transglycosylase domain-containing protein [Leptospiraceae bacterium]|nr:lytic transglycosylase domain-containing protein [Leptospiraceae bacterium]
MDIKTMSWKKIEKNLSKKQNVNKIEAFALARYHEEAPGGQSDKKIKYLYSILVGVYPSSIGDQEISTLISKDISFDSALFKMAYRKLYKALNKKKKLSNYQKIKLLEKVPIEYDPVSIYSFEDLIKVLLDKSEYNQVLKTIFKLSQEEKDFIYTERVKYAHAYSLWKLGDTAKAQEKLFQISKDSENYKIRQKAFNIIKKIVGKSFPKSLSQEELGSIFTMFSRSEQINMIKDGTLKYNYTHKDFSVVRRIAYSLSLRMPKYLLTFTTVNKKLYYNQDEILCGYANTLINSKEHSKALTFIRKMLKESKSSCKYKMLSRIYKKNKDKEKHFKNLLKYLSIYPYDLIYQDQLLEILAKTEKKSIVYASSKYWETAFNEMPNLPVKGRLTYWYLRYLKYSFQKEKLKEVLSKYYEYCPGSYYIGVIAEEFSKDLESLSVPENYLTNRNSLISYISIKQKKDYLNGLVDKDLNFAYYPNSNEMVKSLDNAGELVKKEKILSLSAEYLKLGELKYGMFLANEYVKNKNFDTKSKYELYVGLGDISNYVYLNLYYTRLLMKIWLMPDDPLLLPSGINNRLYPRPHRELVKENSKKYGVDEDIVYAIMRQESFFRENAISIAKARGLMQVMPRTGRFLASKLKVKNYSLHDPEVSIKFGTKFLADLLKNYGDKLTWASIAYNGGPGNLRKWKRNHYKGDFNHFLEELPSKESRDYCRIIISNYNNYKILGKLGKLDY